MAKINDNYEVVYIIDPENFPPYSPLQTIMERRMPSVMPRTRSSSLGNAGSLVKDIRT